MPFIIEALTEETIQDIDGAPRTISVWKPVLFDKTEPPKFNHREIAEFLRESYTARQTRPIETRITEVES